MKSYYKIIWAKCRKCKRIIERIGVWQNGFLVGYLGNNCRHCGLSEKADKDKIDYIQTCLPVENKKDVRVWRDDFRKV